MASEPKDEYISGEEFRNLQQVSSKPRKQITFTSRSIELIVGIVVLCALSFLGGVAYQKHSGAKTTVAATAANSQTRGGFGGTGARRRGGSFGQVTAISTSSITITNQRTSASSTYAITSSTTITDNGSTVDTTDIKAGDTVAITTSTTDTSTATAILVNPSFGGGFGGGAGAAGGASSDSATGQSN